MEIEHLVQLNRRERYLIFAQAISQLEQELTTNMMYGNEREIPILDSLARMYVVMSVMISKGDIDSKALEQKVASLLRKDKPDVASPIVSDKVCYLTRVK